jgi:hypothetical protein
MHHGLPPGTKPHPTLARIAQLLLKLGTKLAKPAKLQQLKLGTGSYSSAWQPLVVESDGACFGAQHFTCTAAKQINEIAI